MNELIYLATPFTDKDPAIQEHRFQVVNKVASDLMKRGLHVFSPISHCYPIALAGGLPKDWAFWEAYDRVMLAVCTKLIVLMQNGWKDSIGVAVEIKIANELGIPVEYMNAETQEIYLDLSEVPTVA